MCAARVPPDQRNWRTPRVGDAARVGLVLAAAMWAVAEGLRAALAFALIAPAVFGVPR
jgi:hypothetical protein